MSKDTSKSASVERALAVLDAFEMDDRYLTLAGIARRTGLAKATLLRILPSLHDHRLVCRADDGTYFVGPASLRLATSHNATVRSGKIIMPVINELVDATKETATYSIRQNDVVLYLHRKNSPHRLRAHVQTGDIAPLASSSAGEIIAAFEDKESENHTALRARMFAVMRGQIDYGIVSISCPVFDHENQVVGAISLHGPESRITGAHLRECVQGLLAAASKITSDFGGRAASFAEAQRSGALEDLA